MCRTAGALSIHSVCNVDIWGEKSGRKKISLEKLKGSELKLRVERRPTKLKCGALHVKRMEILK